MSGSAIVAEGAGNYLSWGVIEISVANLVIIGTMVVIFALAILVPFGSGKDRRDDREGPRR